MGDMFSPDIPDPPTPAKRPERVVEVEEEDIELGSTGTEGADLKTQGKRSLTKPSGGALGNASSGLKI